MSWSMGLNECFNLFRSYRLRFIRLHLSASVELSTRYTTPDVVLEIGTTSATVR